MPPKLSGSALEIDEEDCRIPPKLDFRWSHSGSSHLSLLSTPLTQTKTITYAAFSVLENENLEAAFSALKPAEREAALRKMGEWKEDKKEEPAATASSGSTDKDGKGEKRENKEGEVLVGDMSDMDRNVGRRPSATPSMDADKYPDPDSQPIEPIPDDTPEEEDYDKIKGVPVAQDGLFEVDLTTMSLFPVFWAHTGARVPVIRATWFLEDETKPCSWELAEELEKGYQEIKPWLPSYPQELQKAIEQGASAEEKLKYPMPAKFNVGTSVVYQNKECGQFVQSGMGSYLNKLFWTSFRSKPGGITVYRGYSAALRGSGHEKKLSASAPGSRRGSTSSRRGSTSSNISAGNEDKKDKDKDKVKEAEPKDKPKEKTKAKSGLRKSLDFAIGSAGLKKSQPPPDNSEVKSDLLVPPPQPRPNRQVSQIMEESLNGQGETYQKKKPQVKDALDEEQIPMTADEDDAEECTDLILVIHGIGQQLATTYEGFNFVYATNMLRQVMKQQTANPALASIIRDRRVQILPIQWRASLQLAERGDEDVQHGLDNRFTMSDITLPKIPAIRQITNSVLLDVPLFMSQHRQSMIEAVCIQANKAYRMWCARNPGFDSKGRVHIIGHSLGSALAAHILSNQPTQMPPIADLPKVVKDDTKTQFIFNTSNLFLCGSPLGIFLHIDQAQIIPRKGRERTMHSPPDEALDRAGRFGCMAVDSLYNICHYSDPVAYTLTATVDSEIARDRPPLPITSVTSPFYATVTDPIRDLGKYFDGIPFITSSTNGSGTPNKGNKDAGGAPGTELQRKPIMVRLPSGIEMMGPAGEERLQGSRGERRLNALNPHGNIDFMLPSAGMSEYLDALTSHGAYWSDPSFGAFMLAEIYSTKLDLLRTGMGLARQHGVGIVGAEETV